MLPKVVNWLGVVFVKVGVHLLIGLKTKIEVNPITIGTLIEESWGKKWNQIDLIQYISLKCSLLN